MIFEQKSFLVVQKSNALIHSSLTTNHNSSPRMVVLGDDAMRSQYVPPKPTVKILKRPTRDSQGSGDGPLTNGDNKPKQPIKSLKQREQEYAEARKRILGEERNPEEKLLPEVNKIQPKPSNSGSSNVPSNVVRMPTGPDGSKGFNVRR
ncbi:SUZ domain-containing protein 1 isoform X2 [Cephus cinctus]|uniref:SUZ RNA-binding domain-containing n=1 Tax=Cephus cinctus TaxID=211228 RepID=A0AAJ7RP98_CEPCN|nr:SUZ domain-containing protein 1 isoform X2 [Cephus cinctus]XP_024944606.1 SUZ domain-containing protein 1 isoform X2 [Cephus cinctus]XP_024944607.1 SUZ domain-containing protein 1 isoform X2 [Cephus cinctus]